MSDEKYSDSSDTVLPEISVPLKADEMSLYSHLFGIRPGSDSEIWGGQGRIACCLENFEM